MSRDGRTLVLVPRDGDASQASALVAELAADDLRVDVASPTGGAGTLSVRAVDPHAYVGLAITGSPGVDALVADAATRTLVRVFATSGKPVLAIGRGIRVLAVAHPEPAPNIRGAWSHGDISAFLRGVARARAAYAVPENA